MIEPMRKVRWTGSDEKLAKLKQKNQLKVYVAGPLNSSGLLSSNVRKAVLAGIEIRRAGHLPFIPHLFWFAEYLMGFENENFWLRWDFAELKHCDVLVRLPGKSSGSDKEVKLADSQQMPVFYGLDAFWDWRMPPIALAERAIREFKLNDKYRPSPSPQDLLNQVRDLLNTPAADLLEAAETAGAALSQGRAHGEGEELSPEARRHDTKMWAFYPRDVRGNAWGAQGQLARHIGLEHDSDVPARLTEACVVLDRLLGLTEFVGVSAAAFVESIFGEDIRVQYRLRGTPDARATVRDVQGSGRQDLDDVLRGLLLRVVKEADEQRLAKEKDDDKG